jgi:aldehyde dehydrogenase family 7 protein A1
MDGNYLNSGSFIKLTRPRRNLALSLAAGNATIWKPSPSTPLCSVAVTQIIAEVLKKNGVDGAVAGLVTGDHHIGDALCESEHVTLGMGFIFHS